MTIEIRVVEENGQAARNDLRVLLGVIDSQEILTKLDVVLARLTSIEDKEIAMSVELDRLTAQVQATTTVEQSAIVLIQGIATQLAAAATDPVKLAALAAALEASSTALASAVAAHPIPVPAPTP